MNTPPATPPVIGPIKTISYEFTRWDVFAFWMTGVFRMRIVQIFVVACYLLNGWLLLGPDFGKFSLPVLLISVLFYSVGYVFFFAFLLAVMALAFAFLLKHRGVVGQHVLEITEQGLVERTEYNENLHRWPAIARIFSLCGYLFVYVNDTNCHPIPKRCFPPSEIDDFETELRKRALEAKSR